MQYNERSPPGHTGGPHSEASTKSGIKCWNRAEIGKVFGLEIPAARDRRTAVLYCHAPSVLVAGGGTTLLAETSPHLHRTRRCPVSGW